MSPRQRESISLRTSSGGTLIGHCSWGENPGEWAVLYVHGFGSVRGGEKSQALEMACERRGLTFAAFDFRGHGESSGSLLELRGTGLLEDLEAIQQELVRRGIRRFCPVGSSMGGWVSAWFTVRNPDVVPACVLIAPALDFIRSRWDALSEAERQAWKRTGRLRIQNQWINQEIGYEIVEEANRFSLDQLMLEWSKPLLIFHGMMDDTVPYEQSLRFVQGAASSNIELRLLKNGDHRLSAWKSEIAEAACDFFARHTGAHRSVAAE